MRSRQINTSEQIGGNPGVPGALSNQPPRLTRRRSLRRRPISRTVSRIISRPPQRRERGPRNSSRNETTNYEVDRTIRHTKLNVGDIQRLSVAVVVNYKTLADGKPLPLTAEQMKQIENLTREAMGYSEKRGDTLNVVNSPFNRLMRPAVNCRSGNSRRLSTS
jgi:flagellar M-ring protein FliF